MMSGGGIVSGYQLIRGVVACDGRIVLRFLRCAPAGSDRELVFGHASGPKLRFALSAAIADLAGTDGRVAQVSAEISGGEIRHRALNPMTPSAGQRGARRVKSD